MIAIRTAHQTSDLPALIARDGQLSLAVAYITQDGLNYIREDLQSALVEGRGVRLLFDLWSGNSDPRAVWDLVSLAADFSGLQLRSIIPGSDSGIVHSKLYISQADDSVAFLSGSYNLTQAALNRNYEHGLWVNSDAAEEIASATLAVFQTFWDSRHSRVVDAEAARLYEIYCGRLRRIQSRAQGRAKSAWASLETHMAEAARAPFEWPSFEAAYLMGTIAARGKIALDRQSIAVETRFRPGNYADGRISVQATSYDAASVLPSIPQAIAAIFRNAVPGISVSQPGKRIVADFSSNPDAFRVISQAFSPGTSLDSFGLPDGLPEASEEVVAEFVKGFAVASALLTDHTSMPKNSITGLPGQMMVWLRPQKGNQRMFNSLQALITRRLGIAVIPHWRTDRDPHLKIRCEDFEERIGFGIPWWDDLVGAGAAYNLALYQ